MTNVQIVRVHKFAFFFSYSALMSSSVGCFYWHTLAFAHEAPNRLDGFFKTESYLTDCFQRRLGLGSGRLTILAHVAEARTAAVGTTRLTICVLVGEPNPSP